ncbi:phosphatidylserine decarboxylase [Helicobacter aurati]|uniref:phosphatidylserine decarboxylase n=1 Tax=Helicobacter aurati TaxID=137778 RepID=A0A3D8IXY1_9HELI|nr:phosphatidylserine decarboxylase [Helicobacter aurati]RDU69411.1 phosphatidylserine decarboxylase [Helicobacter aurati]
MHQSNKLSRLFGKFAHKKFPKHLQRIINKTYINLFNIDLHEFEDYTHYESLNALFARTLKKPRTLESKPFNLISPTDSVIMESGSITNNTALQIKGKSYHVLELLYGYGAQYSNYADNTQPTHSLPLNLDSYNFLNLYLSPRDYHHYHAPCDLEILEARYFNGMLLPVNKKSLLNNSNLFVHNERVVLKVRLRYNASIAYFVAVGALNVGKICFNFDERIRSNAKEGNNIYTYENPLQYKAGENLGHFEMGSTVVLIAQAHWSIKTHDVVKMGQEIGTLPALQVL